MTVYLSICVYFCTILYGSGSLVQVTVRHGPGCIIQEMKMKNHYGNIIPIIMQPLLSRSSSSS